MGKYKWGIVVLHYKTVEDTRKCVECLRAYKKNNLNIVVVDNGSGDGSGDYLSRLYADTDNVTLVISDTNLGFAKGNNLGYARLKEKHCDFIVMLNSDVNIEQDNFFDIIEKDYDSSQFDVCGPMILSGDRKPVTAYPQRPVHSTVASTYVGQLMCIAKSAMSFLGIDDKVGRIIQGKQQTTAVPLYISRQENMQISGCCMIFSKNYIDTFDGLNGKTFLYLEEEILLVRVKKYGMKLVYNPDIAVIHFGEASTRNVIRDNAKRKRFRYRHQFMSFRVLREELRSKKRTAR